MSKSQVNICKAFKVSNLQSESATLSLKRSMFMGKKLNYKRCYGENDDIDGAKFKAKKIKPKKLYVCRLEYPKENVYPMCEHLGGSVPVRCNLSSKEHMELLATPKKKFGKPCPKWVIRNIPACTTHLNSLSQPKKLKLVSTLEGHRYHLTFERIEKFLDKLYFGNRQNPREVIESLKQRMKKSRKHIKSQQCEIKRLRIRIAKSEKIQSISTQLMDNVKALLHCNLPVNETCRKLADKILPELCFITGHPIPSRKSTNSLDVSHIKLSEKFAIAVYNYIKNLCHSKDTVEESECLKAFKSLCIPIENFKPVPVQESTIDFDDEDSSLRISSMFETSQMEELDRQLSYLRASQVNVDPDDCRVLFEDLQRLAQELEAKKALKEQRRQEKLEAERANARARAEAEAARLAALRAARRAARNAAGKSCFGNVNPKPQWRVEWKEAVQSELCKANRNKP